MRTTEHTAKTPARNTGRFPVPFALLRAKGSGAPALRLLAAHALAVSALLTVFAASASAARTSTGTTDPKEQA